MIIRQSAVKRYDKQGVTYTYHRATGVRLPDLPLDDPRMIAAIQAADESVQIQSDAFGSWGGRVPKDPDRATPPSVRDVPRMIAYSALHCVQFVLHAKPRDILYYHRGFLHKDGQTNDDVRERGQYCAIAAEFGLIELRQKRMADSLAEYYAIRTDEPLKGVPRFVIEGAVAPEEYRALVALNERQSSVSTSRTIRNALGCDDTTASHIRNTMIRRGWLTNSRPPQLTEAGLLLLT